MLIHITYNLLDKDKPNQQLLLFHESPKSRGNITCMWPRPRALHLYICLHPNRMFHKDVNVLKSFVYPSSISQISLFLLMSLMFSFSASSLFFSFFSSLFNYFSNQFMVNRKFKAFPMASIIAITNTFSLNLSVIS